MRRIIIEKTFVYVLCFLFCFIVSLLQGNSSNKVEQKFLNDISSIMKKYDYVKTDSLTYDLRYDQEDNNIKINYDANIDNVKVKNIDTEFNLNYTSDLSSIYSLLDELYDNNISDYSNKIKKMINDYSVTGEEQSWRDLNSKRHITLLISKPTTSKKDYQLYYSVMMLHR